MFALARWCRMNFPAAAGGHRETAVARTGLLRHQLFQMAFFCALFFLYTGTEASLGGWLAMLAQRLGSLPSELHAMAPTFFWGALVGGRGLTVIALHRIPERYLSLMGLASAVVGVSMLTVAGSYSQIVTGALIAGLGLAPVFPLFVTHLTRHFGDAAGRAAAVGFAFSGVGPALLPWLVGATSAQFGSLKAGLGVPLCSALLLLALDPFRTRGERR
jgi:fucose permease